MAESKNSPKSTSKIKTSKIQANEEENSSGSSVSLNEGVDDESGQQIGHGVGTAEVTVDRNEYLQAHRDLTFDRNQVQLKNNILQRRLAEYYKKRKLDHVLKPMEGAADLEDKYHQKLLAYDELKEKGERELADIKTKMNAVTTQYIERLENAETKFDGLQAHEKNTGTGLIYTKKGKPIADKTVHRFLILQKRKSEQSSSLRLRYIRVRNAVNELENIVRKLEMIAPGLYVAQYEQLHIDNQNLKTKIEEREDELINNRAKCTEHNQILAHIREKMHHSDEVIDTTEVDLEHAEMVYLRAREDLGVVKSRRDKLRWSLGAEGIKAGLLTRKDLLRDFQNATEEVVILREKKIRLEEQIIKIAQELTEARKCMQFNQTDTSG